MNPFVRFWIPSLSLAVGVTAFGYLFMSFIFPDPELVQTGMEIRLTATFLPLTGMGLFVWTALFAASDARERESVPTR